jgi:tRNA synthetases class I (E and Q), anti-codon binding domain
VSSCFSRDQARISSTWIGPFSAQKKKKFIDPVAPRHTAIVLDNAVKCNVTGINSEVVFEDKPKHLKRPAVGTKKAAYSNTIWIEHEDAIHVSENEGDPDELGQCHREEDHQMRSRSPC